MDKERCLDGSGWATRVLRNRHYCIAALNVEESYRERRGTNAAKSPWRNRANRYVQPEQLPEHGLFVGEQRALLAAEEPPILVILDNLPVVGLTEELRRRQPQPALTRDRNSHRAHIRGALHGDPQRQPARHLQDGKDLPRILFAPDFRAFVDTRAALAKLHLRYEDTDFPEHPFEVLSSTGHTLRPGDYRLGTGRMGPADKARAILILNDRARLTGSPVEAHCYAVNGRTLSKWLIYSYTTTTDKRNGERRQRISSPPTPTTRSLTIVRIVCFRFETEKIVDTMPDPFGNLERDERRKQ